MRKQNRIAVLAALGLVVLASCNQSTTGIFAFIEAEVKIAEGNLGSERTVASMAEDATRYFVAGGTKLSHREKGGTEWTSEYLSVDGVSLEAPVQAVRSLDAGGVYALAGEGADAAVYHLASTGTDSWTKVTLPDLPATGIPVQLVPVIDSDGHTVVALLVVTTVDATAGKNYRHLFVINGDTGVATAGDLGEDISNGVTAAAQSGSGFYLLNRTTLWKTDANLLSPAKVTPLPDSAGFVGLLAVAGTSSLDGFYLSTLRNGTTGGSVHKGSLAGTTWTPASTALTGSTDVKDAAGNALDLGMLFLPASGSLLVATDKAGFAEISADKLTVGSVNYAPTSYASGALSSSQVLNFFLSSDATLFVGTSAAGLWKYKSALPAAWSVE